MPFSRTLGMAVVITVAACNTMAAPTARSITGEEKGWAMFETAAKSKSVPEREIGIRALGLLPDNARARQLAENALSDPKPEVRVAAATALGQMRATASIPKLQKALSDPRLAVVMAAAHSLRDLKDNNSAYSVYYDVLTGKRKSGESMIQRQLDTLHNPKEVAKIGFEAGIGYVPFAGIGWDAWRYMHKKNPMPVRAVAASFLAHDPDPATGVALAEAIKDKDWIVRAAAIEAIAERSDPYLKAKVELSFFDANIHVRFTTAAAVIRLTELDKSRKAAEQH
ncbi:MAG TPA: HEAT repeat domain-containing protein [Candidatus Sulfotelmatobacter sp.]